MNSNQLVLPDLVKLILKNKILFISIFVLTSILAIYFVSKVEPTYKSSLSISLPLRQGVETKYAIENLIELKSDKINKLIGLNKDIEVGKIEISNFQNTSESVFAVISFITTQPDLDFKVKNAFINYINELDYLKGIKENEKLKFTEIISSAEKEFARITDGNQPLVEDDKTNIFISSVNIIEKKHEAQFNLANTKAIVEIFYAPSAERFKPSYSLLYLLSLVFAFFLAFTIVVSKVFFYDVVKDLKNETNEK